MLPHNRHQLQRYGDHVHEWLISSAITPLSKSFVQALPPFLNWLNSCHAATASDNAHCSPTISFNPIRMPECAYHEQCIVPSVAGDHIIPLAVNYNNTKPKPLLLQHDHACPSSISAAHTR